MNVFYEYLDLPTVPVSLLDELDDIINRPMLDLGEQLDSPNDPSARNHWPVKIKKELYQWLCEHFEEEIIAYYVISKAMLPPHMDRRGYCYNYILNDGGSDVQTYAYIDQDKVECVRFQPKKWIKLNNRLTHGTIGYFVGMPRVILQITPLSFYKGTSMSHLTGVYATI